MPWMVTWNDMSVTLVQYWIPQPGKKKKRPSSPTGQGTSNLDILWPNLLFFSKKNLSYQCTTADVLSNNTQRE